MPTAELPLPHTLVRGQDTTISCPLYDGAALAAPSTGTVIIRNAAGDEVVSSASVTITGDVATYTAAAALTSSESTSDRWSVVWTLDGVQYFNNCFVVRQDLVCTVTTKALTDRLPILNGNTSNLTSRTDWSTFVEAAWIEVQLRLIEEGRRPDLVLQPTSLRQVTLLKALELAFEDLSTYAQDNGELYERAEEYRNQYLKAWGDITLVYDADEDGIPDDDVQALGGPVWAC